MESSGQGQEEELRQRLASLEAQLQEMARRMDRQEATSQRLEEQLQEARGGGAAAKPEAGRSDGAAAQALEVKGGQEAAGEDECHELSEDDLKQIVAEDSGHEVKASAWDTAMFIGLPAIGCGGSLIMVIVLVLNILGQSVFVLMMTDSPYNFLQNSLPPEGDIARWRGTVGHSLEYEAGGVSLTSRVCVKDAALAVAGTQVAAVQQAEAYTESALVFLQTGPLLCCLILMLWFLTVFADILDNFGYVAGLYGLPRGVTRLEYSKGEITIRSISRMRLACMFLIAAVRFVIALFLLATGGQWLARTTSLESLVLNGAAMSFVLGFDELLFAAAGPQPVQELLSKFQPLPTSRQPIWKGVGPRSVTTLLVSLVFVSGMLGTEVLPTRDALEGLNRTMCGGNQDFVFSVHPENTLMQHAPTLKFDSTTAYASLVANSRLSIVQDIVWGREATAQRVADLDSLAMINMFGASDYAFSMSCEDNEAFLEAYLPTFRVLFSHPNLTTCASARMWCDRFQTSLIRMLCPATCGCDSPRSGLWTWRGCPRACWASDNFTRELTAIPCRDMTPQELGPHPGWNRMGGWKYGSCENVPFKMCVPNSQMIIGSFRYFCPQRCNCVAGGLDCPPSCR